MIQTRFLRQALFISFLTLFALCVFSQAQSEDGEFQPTVGQPGKDVIWVPTAQALADKMLDLAQVTPQDYVIDLGSGDGRIVITAAQRGARALGVEYNPDMVALSIRNAAREKVSDRAQFIKQDLFETDLSQATVITMFLLPGINMSLRPRILALRPGTRIVSNSFDMEDWTADQTVEVSKEEGCDNFHCEAYFWVVPAKVQGTWEIPGGQIRLEQTFQMLSGSVKLDGKVAPITGGRLWGADIGFTTGNTRYTGHVNGDSMELKSERGGKTVTLSATRTRRTGSGKERKDG